MVKFEVSPYSGTPIPASSLNMMIGSAYYDIGKLRGDAETAITNLEEHHAALNQTCSEAAEVITSLDRQCEMLQANQAQYASIVKHLETRLDVVSRGFTACASVLDIVKKNNILTPFEERLDDVEGRLDSLEGTVSVMKMCHTTDMATLVTELEERLATLEDENSTIKMRIEHTYTLLTGAYMLGGIAIAMAILNY